MQDQNIHGEAFGSDDLWFKLHDTIRTYNIERDLHYMGGELMKKKARGCLQPICVLNALLEPSYVARKR